MGALVELSTEERRARAGALLGDAQLDGRILLGWEEDDAVVACCALARRSQIEIELQTLVVAEEARGRGVGRALLEAVADAATCDALVADAEPDGFLAACGFVAGEGGRARLELLPSPDPAPSRPLTLTAIEAAVRAAWSADTADDPSEWTPENPATNQCAVTALVLRDLLGGEILVANVLRDGRRVERHAWNRLPSGLELDLTREQFRAGELLERPHAAEPIVALRDPERVARFAARVRERLGD